MMENAVKDKEKAEPIEGSARSIFPCLAAARFVTP